MLRARYCLTILVLLGLATGPGSADTATTLGDRSGEGSTAFTGLAQAPEAALSTGALATNIPIELPPGRKNMTPKLVLTYSTASGPSPYGYGWDLPIGRIERSTKRGAPRCNDGHTDDFVLAMSSGTYELVAVGGGDYRPKYEEGYLRAKQEAAGKWTVWDRSGIKYVFGDSLNSRVDSTAGCPSGQSFTSVAGLSRIEDPNGNSIDIIYFKLGNVLQPYQISYGGNDAAGVGHFYHVDFVWEFRDDQIMSGRAGIATQLLLRLNAITLRTDNPPSPGLYDVRQYRFEYDAQGEPNGIVSRLSEVGVYPSGDPSAAPLYPVQSFVYTSTHATHAASSPLFLPPGFEGVRGVADGELRRTIMDMNGDGHLDLVYARTSTEWDVHFGYGDGTFADTPIVWANPGGEEPALRKTTGGTEIRTQIDTLDLTGDGLPDYVVAAKYYTGLCTWSVYPGRAPTGPSGWRFEPTPILWRSPLAFIRFDRKDDIGNPASERNLFSQQDLVDMNGDGRLDLVAAPGDQAAQPPHHWKVYINTGFGFDADPSTTPPLITSCVEVERPDKLVEIVPNPPIPGLPPNSNFDPVGGAAGITAPSQWLSHTQILDPGNQGGEGRVHSQLADFNGDGLADFIAIDDSCAYGVCLAVYGGTGAGFYTATASPLTYGTRFIRRWKEYSTTEDLIDLNGDGLPDRVVVGNPAGGPR